MAEIGGPKIIISNLTNEIETLNAGVIPDMGGEVELLEEKFIDIEDKKGRGGVVYYSINGGSILYFPYAKYGMFIKRAEM